MPGSNLAKLWHQIKKTVALYLQRLYLTLKCSGGLCCRHLHPYSLCVWTVCSHTTRGSEGTRKHLLPSDHPALTFQKQVGHAEPLLRRAEGIHRQWEEDWSLGRILISLDPPQSQWCCVHPAPPRHSQFISLQPTQIPLGEVNSQSRCWDSRGGRLGLGFHCGRVPLTRHVAAYRMTGKQNLGTFILQLSPPSWK